MNSINSNIKTSKNKKITQNSELSIVNQRKLNNEASSEMGNLFFSLLKL